MVLSFGQGFKFFKTRVLNKNDFKKLSHALISLYKFNLEHTRTLERAATFEHSRKCYLSSQEGVIYLALISNFKCEDEV